MTTRLRCLIAMAFLPVACCLLPVAFSQAQSDVTAQQVEAGRQLYAGSCGNSYCHGSEGKGGGAPILRDRVFRAGYLRAVITDGSDGTPMPGFKSRMTAQEINQLVAYLLSLSPGKGDKPEQAFATKAAPPAGNTANAATNEHFNQTPGKPQTEPANQPPKVSLSVSGNGAAIRGEAQAGHSLFFDQSSANNCSACHSVNGVGGKVASDLSRLRDQTPRQLALRILAPQNSEPASDLERYGLLQITTRGGEKVVGIKRDEDAESLRLYDTATRPPISRSFLKADIASIEKLLTAPCPGAGGSYAEKFAVKQLLDLIAFLKSADLKNPASISLNDLF
ncbi:MAG: c-type cytochrome [Acidobacteria bacterium]|nr:c-type cytochrome [Acidobacteriota bacterium]MBI3427165.1 c-type cytochrome [Acidobacteriota bacterium]